jgi:meso-butanediol dehydrogenase/(S,S)-butanediol dehydrogenase/diacetyl reductase
VRFTDRSVIVTGGGSGIGAELSRQFAREEAVVAVADIDGPAAAQVASEISARGGSAFPVDVDVTDERQVRSMTELVTARVGYVDIVVNNASNKPSDDILGMSVADWDNDVRVSLRGPFLCTRSALPAMLDRGRGVFVNIASVNAFAFYGNEAYSAAKAGLLSLTRSVAVRYGARGIRANAIALGTIRTPIWSARVDLEPTVLDRAAAWYPAQRVGEVGDAAAAALFLASDEASWISGSVLSVDGGLTAGNYRMTAELVRESDW